MIGICSVQVYRHSFRPLIYLFSKQIETVESVKMAMIGLQIVSVKYFGQRLRPGVNISDHSDGLRSGMQYINIDHLAPEEEVVNAHSDVLNALECSDNDLACAVFRWRRHT